METAAKPPAALWILVALLLVGGGTIMYRLRGFSTQLAPPAPSQAGTGLSVPSSALPDFASSLRTAISSNDASAVRSLKDKGADLNAQYLLLDSGRRTMTPLTFAALQPTPEMVRALLDAGAKPDLPSESGVTPLMMAAARSDAATVESLLEAGAPADDQDKWGETALMKAAQSGSREKVRLLLAAGALTKPADNDGNTALTWAAGLGGTPQALQALLDAGADPDAANASGVTPLMRAAETGDAARCMTLLNAGANPGLKDSNGRTAADWATMRSDESGADCAALLSRADG